MQIIVLYLLTYLLKKMLYLELGHHVDGFRNSDRCRGRLEINSSYIQYISYTTLQRQNTEISKQIFPE